MSKKTQEFQAEIKDLMNLMIHSLYSHKEIFLRELISNASDAIDKLQFETLTQRDLIKDDTEFQIRLEPDNENNRLKILDNGIGMSYDEVITNLGTIAKSGTKEFLKRAAELKDNPELIGQFGVGFYSSFMAAKKVIVHTQKAGTSEGVLWESDGTGSYTIDKIPRPEGHGTTITLELKTSNEMDEKEEHQDFTNHFTLSHLVKKYSDFISTPIKMKNEKSVPKKDDEGNPIKDEWEKVIEDETLNSQKALWLKKPSEIEEEEYNEFYRHICHDWNPPAKTIHFKAEGTLSFNSLIYIPGAKPFNYNTRDAQYGLNLYVKRVFIMDNCSDLLPDYLRFVKGVVDSDDLSLNVSREILQQDRQVTAIRKSLTKKVLGSLASTLKDQREDYEKIWAHFGSTLKEGMTLDPSNKEKLQDLYLFHSSDSNQLTTLSEYVKRMKEGQKEIFFITGEDLEKLKNSPYLEQLKEKNYEVLFMVDPVDEWLVEQLTTYNDHKLQSITKENLDLESDEEKKAKEEERKGQEERFTPIINFMKDHLKEELKDIRLSTRLKESPVCLVAGEHDPSAHMERILSGTGSSYAKSKRIMEINPSHPVFEKMFSAPKETQENWAEILYSQALLAEGSVIPDPAKFSQQISHLMTGFSMNEEGKN